MACRVSKVLLSPFLPPQSILCSFFYIFSPLFATSLSRAYGPYPPPPAVGLAVVSKQTAVSAHCRQRSHFRRRFVIRRGPLDPIPPSLERPIYFAPTRDFSSSKLPPDRPTSPACRGRVSFLSTTAISHELHPPPPSDHFHHCFKRNMFRPKRPIAGVRLGPSGAHLFILR